MKLQMEYLEEIKKFDTEREQITIKLAQMTRSLI